MKAKSLDRESASSKAAAQRRPSPRLVFARRIDSERPTRVWSLLLPPRFLNGGQELAQAGAARTQPRGRAAYRGERSADPPNPPFPS